METSKTCLSRAECANDKASPGAARCRRRHLPLTQLALKQVRRFLIQIHRRICMCLQQCSGIIWAGCALYTSRERVLAVNQKSE